MRHPLLRRGPGLAGLMMILFGLGAFALPAVLPEPTVPGGAAEVARITGMIGGGLIGLGLVMTIIAIRRG